MRQPEMQALLHELAASLHPAPQDYPERIASRVGERTHLIELSAVTHFFARDKLTYAVAAGRSSCVDQSIAELERRLDPKRFIRIHRAILLNLDWVEEAHSRLGGQVTVALKDAKRTQLTVARDRESALKQRLRL